MRFASSRRSLGAAPDLPGSARSLLCPGLDHVGAGEQLIGAALFGGDGGRRLAPPAGRQGRPVLVEQRLVFVAGALGVIENVLGGGAARLRPP